MLTVYTSPYTSEIQAPWVPEGVQLYLRREDVIHPDVSGNKWRKLDLNLEEAARRQAKTLVTFGGAFSNHIYATAAAAQETGFDSVGIIRGEASSASNATLSYARKCGMELVFVHREAYRNKQALWTRLSNRWQQPYLLPEGGTNCLAVEGCRKIVTDEMFDMDVVCVPVGTGGTMAGLIAALPSHIHVYGFSVLKGNFLQDEVMHLVQTCHVTRKNNWTVDTGSHYGGYARITEALLAFIREFREEHGVLLDPVYTGKMMFRLKGLMEAGAFAPGTKICAIHTGGLQGWDGIRERFGIERP